MAQNSMLLIDAASLIYRALYSVPDTVTADDGTPMNAAYGFINMLARLIADRDPAYICCAADDDWRPAWRVDLIESYKAQRAAEGSAQEEAEDILAPQEPVIAEILARVDVPVVGFEGYEAEDVIGTLAERAPGEVAIVSGDRDLFQLVRDPSIYVLFPRKGVSELDLIDESYIATKYQIPGNRYGDFAILRGDPSDNLPGVRGVGEKLAAALVSRHGSIEAIVDAASSDEDHNVALNKVRRELDYVRRAIEVVTIPVDLPIPDVDLTRPRSVDNVAELEAYAANFGLAGSVRRLVEAITS